MRQYTRKGRPNATGRRSTEPFIKLTRNITDSPSWKALSNTSVRIYLEIKRRYIGTNNGEIPLSCREASAVAHCSKGTASQAFKELQEHGFIREAEKGMFTYRKATTWILTSEVCGNHSPTNDWKQWQPKITGKYL